VVGFTHPLAAVFFGGFARWFSRKGREAASGAVRRLLTGGLLVRIQPEEQSFQQVADDDAFAWSSHCPFPSAFQAGLSSMTESTRMLALQQLLRAPLSSELVHVQDDQCATTLFGQVGLL